MTSSGTSAQVRRRLNHPVIDADGHWNELQPIFLDYIAQAGGAKAADAYRKMAAATYGFTWYDVSPAERSRQRLARPPWWIKVTDTYYRTTTMVPALFNERLDEFGIDFSLV